MDRVYRYNNNTNTPINNGLGYTMWTDTESEVETLYGPVGWTIDVTGLISVQDIIPEIEAAFSEDLENNLLSPELDDAGLAILDELDPDNIVNSAEAWDNLEFVSWFWHRIGCTRDLVGFSTDDGAILFDHTNVQRI